MEIEKRLADSVEENRMKLQSEDKELNTEQLASDISSVFGLGATPKKNTNDLLESGIGWVYACVDSISNELANIRLKLFEQKGGGDIEEIHEHPILELLARANGSTTKYDLFYLTQQYLELVGEAPWFLQFENGKPVNIYLLRPDRITVLPPKSGDTTLVGGYTYRVDTKNGTQEVKLEINEVVFLKYPDPTKVFRGRGTLQAVLKSYDIDDTAEKFNLKFFENAATPSSVFTTDKKISKETRRKLEKILKRKYENFTNAHKTMILEQGLDWKSMALSQREMDFIETMKFTRDKILAIFRVPKSVLGITEDVNRANAEASDFVFGKRTIQPKMQKLVEMLNEFLVPLFDNNGKLFLDYEEPTPENQVIKLQQAREGIISGYLTINEARELLGFEALDEGGDVVFAPSTPNVPPTEQGKRKRRKRVVRVNPLYKNANRARTRKYRENKQKIKTIVNTVEKTITPIIEQSLRAKRNLKSMKSVVLAQKIFSSDKETARKEKFLFQEKQLRVGAEFERRFAKTMAFIFMQQKQRALKKLGEKAVNNVLNEADEIKVTVKRLNPIVLNIIIRQSEDAFRLLGQDDKLSSGIKVVAEYLEKRVFRFSKEITEETNKQLAQLLADSVRDGDSISQTKKKITSMFSRFANSRAKKIARSEIIRATSFATEETYVQSGVVEAKEWLAFIDERTDDECIALDGKVIGLGRNYFEKGDKFQGLSLNYENIAGPPLHVNCRCTLIPVVVA